MAMSKVTPCADRAKLHWEYIASLRDSRLDDAARRGKQDGRGNLVQIYIRPLLARGMLSIMVCLRLVRFLLYRVIILR